MEEPFYGNIETLTLQNTFYRYTLYTSDDMQLIVMNVPVGDDIELEEHDADQFIRCEKGFGNVYIGDSIYVLRDGMSIIIPKHTYHYIVNKSKTDPLKLYTIYSPPTHPSNTIEKYHN